MKRLFAFLLALAMVLSLAACGGSEESDPNAGKYIGVTAAVGGFSMPMSDIYPGETWIELKSGGKGNIMLDGDSYSLKWALEGEAITITLEGVDSVGTLSGGAIVVDLMNMGCVMTFRKEGTEPAEPEGPAVTYNDAGYWDLIRVDGAAEEDSISEENMALVKEAGMLMYLELLEDGTGMLFMDEEMPVTWVDGTITFTEDDMTINYTLENGDLILDMLENVLVFRKGEKQGGAKMEAAGFTEFMEIGMPYAYTTATNDDNTIATVGEAIVTSYEVFDSAEGYSAGEGYEWRVVKMQIRFYDENTSLHGCKYGWSIEDYYTPGLRDDTEAVVKETDTYTAYGYTVVVNGQEMDAYCYCDAYWGDWYVGDAGNDEIVAYLQWDFLVPVDYDGSVACLFDRRMEWPEGAHITDLDPANFLLFRAD